MKNNVMKKAWEIRRAAASRFGCKVTEISMSVCLKQAWKQAKGEIKMIDKIANFTITEWQKYGKKRIYFNNEKKGGSRISFFWDCDKQAFNNKTNSAFMANLHNKIKIELGL